MHSASSFSSSTRSLSSNAQNTQPVSRILTLAGIAAEAEGLPVAEDACAAVVRGHDVVHLQGSLVLVCPAPLAASSGAGEHPVVDRTADRRAGAEGIEALAAELQQLDALGVAQLLASHQGVGALLRMRLAMVSRRRW